MANEVINKIKMHTDKVLPLISAFCDKVGIVEIIDKEVDLAQNDRIISTGTAIKALLINNVSSIDKTSIK